jgi:DNA-binding NarL/FixJ family response regulator
MEASAPMVVRVAVSDPLPAFRRGVMAILGDAGFDSEAPHDLIAWIQREERKVILLTLRSPDDWALLTAIRRTRADVTVVAVLDEANDASYVRALMAGAVAAVPRDAAPHALRETFEAALQDRSLLPIKVVRALTAAEQTADQTAGAITAREIDWLQQLAHGVTVADLADRAGYSERMMFRLLRNLYNKLQVSNRTEALMLARDRGWV